MIEGLSNYNPPFSKKQTAAQVALCLKTPDLALLLWHVFPDREIISKWIGEMEGGMMSRGFNSCSLKLIGWGRGGGNGLYTLHQ